MWVCIWKSWIVQVCEIEEKRKKEKNACVQARNCAKGPFRHKKGGQKRERETAREREGDREGALERSLMMLFYWLDIT